MLMELPYAPYKEWMINEIYNLSYNYKLVPVIAHVERYLQWYSSEQIEQVLSIQEAILQINHEALFEKKTQRFTLELIRGGFPVIFGSDAHNTSERPPNIREAYKWLKGKLKRHEYHDLIMLNSGLL